MDAPDAPHHPPSPFLNFVWVFVVIFAIFFIATCVKIWVNVMKRRRAKRRDPSVELQDLNRHERRWFPWRFGLRGASGGSSTDSNSNGAGESSRPASKPQFPQTPDRVRLREAVFDKLVSSRHKNKPADLEQGQSHVMTGALGFHSVTSLPGTNTEAHSNISSLSSRLNRAGVPQPSSSPNASLLSSPGLDPTASIANIDNTTSRSNHTPQLPPINTSGVELEINPYTWKPSIPPPRRGNTGPATSDGDRHGDKPPRTMARRRSSPGEANSKRPRGAAEATSRNAGGGASSHRPTKPGVPWPQPRTPEERAEARRALEAKKAFLASLKPMDAAGQARRLEEVKRKDEQEKKEKAAAAAEEKRRRKEEKGGGSGIRDLVGAAKKIGRKG